MAKNNEPQAQDFEGQHEGEEVVLVFRRHIIAMRKGFYMLLIPFAVSSIPPLIWQDNLVLFLLPLAGLLLGLVLFMYQFLMWYFTVYIFNDKITDKRLDNDRAKFENLTENPGIESNTNNLTATRVTLTRSNEWSAGGSYSARLTATGGGGSSDSYITLGGDQGALRTNLEAGKTYTVSATIQLPAPLTGTLHARSRTIAFWFNGASNLALSNQAPNITGQTRLSVTATIPPGSNNAWIRLYHGGLNGSGIVYWDNIMITEGSDLHGFAGCSVC
jgi:hypothetical protein